VLLACASAALSVGLMYSLVQKDFFLASFRPLTRRRSSLTALWAASWVLVVTGAALSALMVVIRIIIPEILTLVSRPRSDWLTEWDLHAMWDSMSIIAKVVVFILFILSAWSLGVMIDRALMYSAARKQSRVFVQQVAEALREGKLEEAISIAERNKKSHIAKVMATSLSEFQSASAQVSEAEVVEAAKRGLNKSIATINADMKQGLPNIAKVGLLAPVVALSGALLELLVAVVIPLIQRMFSGIENASYPGVISRGLGLSLTTVEVSLFCAFLAAMMTSEVFSYLHKMVDTLSREINRSSSELIDILAAHAPNR
jgi:biopolymer transport protein ExbB